MSASWLQEAIERWGEPQVKPPVPETYAGPKRVSERGIHFGGTIGWRRAWVWFPEGINHHLTIDDHDGKVTVRAGCHHGTLATFTTDWGDPTEDQIRSVLALGWHRCSRWAGTWQR